MNNTKPNRKRTSQAKPTTYDAGELGRVTIPEDEPDRAESRGGRAVKANPRRFNRLYRAEVCHTEIGSPIIKIVPEWPKSPSGTHRQIAAFVYDLASDMEKRSEELKARWA